MPSIISETSKRVPKHTSDKINAKIRRKTGEHIEAAGADVNKIEARLRQLDKEWDIERAIEANASSLILAGLAMGATVNKRWYFLPLAVAGFLFQHSIQGWCPPVPVLRRLGFRTQREIDDERAVLKARRGDFEEMKNMSPACAVDAMST